MSSTFVNKVGTQNVRLAENARGPYGNLLVSNLVPYVAGSAEYNLIPANFREFTASGGSTGVSNKKFQVQSGTSAGGYGTIRSFRSINYKTGQGAVVRFSGIFNSNQENSWSGIGAFNIGDEYSFGYNGTDFGIWHRYGGKAEVQTLTVTGAAGGSENATVTLDGTGYTVPLTASTVQTNAKEIADYIQTNSTEFEAYQLDDTVVFYALSDGDKTGSFSFSSATATATYSETTAGITKTSDRDWETTVSSS